MCKLTIDDLVAAQQRTETTLAEIATLLRRTKPTKGEEVTSVLSGLLSVIVWCVGAVVAYNGNLVGVCVCLIAISARLERLLRR